MSMVYETLLHAIMCSEFLINIWQSQILEALRQKIKSEGFPQAASLHF
jgi:hypothetical protein